ncbi:MAG: anion transporter [Acidobacteria bacterium RBG_16_68_9]|nr:MAG: anion transporter [Acidobacteria bacterium RBG_16_68_9]
MPVPADVVIDTRPLWQLLVSRSRRPLLLVAGALLYWGIRALPQPEGLSVEGQAALAVFALCVVYWVFDVLPLMITSLLAMIMIPLSGVISASQTYAFFGNEAIFFILGAFILAACLMKSKLSSRIALAILSRFGSTPRTLLITVLLLNAGMSFLMSEHAVAAMNFPIILEIASVLRLSPRRSTYGKALFLAMAWGTTIGGIATLLGGARAPLALGILKEATGRSFSFLEWSVAIFPLVPVLLVACYMVIVYFFPIDVASVQAADDVLHAKRMALGRMRYKERAIGIVVLLTVVAWIVAGEEFGLATIALAAVVVLFLFRLVSWREIEGYVNWGVILMYGGAICLGAAMNKSGASVWIAHVFIKNWATGSVSVILILSFLGILLTELMSNSAVVALLMPVSLGIAQEFGMDPRIMALAVAVPAGIGYTLPIGTPANAIAYSSGHLSIRDMVVPGILLAVLSWLAFNAVAYWYWPLVGLSIR